MKSIGNGILAGLLMAAAVPLSATAQMGDVSNERYVAPAGSSSERVLSEAEITDLLNRSREAGIPVSRDSANFQYMGGSQDAIETQVCCEPVQEEVTTEMREDITESFFDAITAREIIQPVERTIIQPIERQILDPQTETVTEAVRFEEERLPVIIQEDPVPAMVENVIEQETVERRDDITETYYDVIARRDIIQPVERTVVVPVQRRILREKTETVTAPTRFEENILPTIIQEDPVPAVVETFTPQISESRVEEVTDVMVPYMAERNVYQPVERTIVQPIERRILQPRTETITRDTIFQEEVLPTRVETEAAPQIVENTIEEVTERVVYEVEDVYIDQITRNVIQPVVVTNVQPIERRILRPQAETITEATRYEEERLSMIVQGVDVPETVVNYIPQVTTNQTEELTETYFEAVTQRDIYQPIVRTVVQPVEIRKVRPQVETVTAPTRYETVRGSQIVINIGTGGCACGSW